jgi:hypothetical protein
MDFKLLDNNNKIIKESNNLEELKQVAKDNNLTEGNIKKKNGRLAIGDWYGAEDDDLGWEYD